MTRTIFQTLPDHVARAVHQFAKLAKAREKLRDLHSRTCLVWGKSIQRTGYMRMWYELRGTLEVARPHACWLRTKPIVYLPPHPRWCAKSCLEQQPVNKLLEFRFFWETSTGESLPQREIRHQVVCYQDHDSDEQWCNHGGTDPMRQPGNGYHKEDVAVVRI